MISLRVFLLLALAVTFTSAQDVQCGDTTTEPINVSSNFTSLQAGAVCENNCDEWLVPKELHWHVYVTSKGSQPRHSITPPGILTPQVNDGWLSYQYSHETLETYAAGDRIQAGVSLYVPEDRLDKILIAGVDQWIQIHAENLTQEGGPLVITDTTIDSHLFVTSPNAKVDVTANGVDTALYVEAAAGSSLTIGGVDIEASVKCPALTLRATGVDNDIVVEGTVVDGILSGVDADVEINGNGLSGGNPCANVSDTGVGNDCDDTNDVFESVNLSCLADTKIVYDCSYWNMSAGATAGVTLGALALVAAIVVASIYCCGCCGCCKKDKDKFDGGKAYPVHNVNVVPMPPPKMVGHTAKGEEDTHASASVMEAEVIDVKDSATSNGSSFENVDLESAKQQHADYNIHVY